MRSNKLDLNQFHQLKRRRKRTVSAKKQIRDMERLMDKLRASNQPIDEAKLQELNQMKLQQSKKEKSQEIKTGIDKKYQKFKFFEMKKLNRMERSLKAKQLNDPENEDLKASLQEIQNKFAYIKNYPSGQKYISILKVPSDEKVRQVQEKIMKKALTQQETKVQEREKRKSKLVPLEREI